MSDGAGAGCFIIYLLISVTIISITQRDIGLYLTYRLYPMAHGLPLTHIDQNRKYKRILATAFVVHNDDGSDDDSGSDDSSSGDEE